MAMRGRPALTNEEAREVADLYAWGMEVWVICAYYDIHKRTLKDYLKREHVPSRPTGRRRDLDLDATSNRRRSPAPAGTGPDPFEDAYREVRARARALLDTRTGPHPEGVSTRSYLEVPS